MEERLDDALNVLRNHCEPQLGISIANMDGSPFVGSPAGPGPIPQDNSSNEPPTTVKLERVSSNSSESNEQVFLSRFEYLICNFFFHLQKNAKNHQMQTQNQVVQLKDRPKV